MRGLLIASMFLATTANAADSVTVIRFGKLIDGKGNVINNPSIVVRGERVERIATASEPLPPAAKVIDLRKLTAIPGLIDVHTHMTFYWDRTPGTKPWTQLGSLGAPVTSFSRRRTRARRSSPASRPCATWARGSTPTSRCAISSTAARWPGRGCSSPATDCRLAAHPEAGLDPNRPMDASRKWSASRGNRSARASTGSRCTARPAATRTSPVSRRSRSRR